MSKRITLGGLFDGIGGFPLSGVVCGIEPVWASEIEPFPIAVTMNRFPNMKHLGSVTDIKGDQIEPIRKTWAEVNGKSYKPCKNREALIKWFNGLQTDSAEYKAYGNSLAIPCSYDVISRIAKAIMEGE